MKRISQRQLKKLQQLKSELASLELHLRVCKAAYEGADQDYQDAVANYRKLYDKAYN